MDRRGLHLVYGAPSRATRRGRKRSRAGNFISTSPPLLIAMGVRQTVDRGTGFLPANSKTASLTYSSGLTYILQLQIDHGCER